MVCERIGRICESFMRVLGACLCEFWEHLDNL